MASKTVHLPAAPAEVDNQKNADTCSLFAISKAVCNGFETDKDNAFLAIWTLIRDKQKLLCWDRSMMR